MYGIHHLHDMKVADKKLEELEDWLQKKIGN
jgi:hypothetical protein